MTYTHVQFAYYATFTQQQYQPAILQNQRGLMDSRTEIRVRAQHFVDVARYVAGKIAANPVAVNGRVLTIFAAPEFYLRSSVGQRGGPGHYDQADVAEARMLIRDSVAADSRFDDWLLVPGTAVYSTAFDYAALSFSLIFSDAYCVARPAGQPIVEWHCVKQDFSHLDDLDQDFNASRVDSGVVNQQIMTLNGVDIGLEICLDHSYRALKNTVLLHSPPRNLDVQLLVGCGSDAELSGVATRSNGLVLRCNGNNYRPPPGKGYRVGLWPGGQPARKVSPSLSAIPQPHQPIPLPQGLQIMPNPLVPDTAGYFGPLALRPPPPPPGPPPGP